MTVGVGPVAEETDTLRFSWVGTVCVCVFDTHALVIG